MKTAQRLRTTLTAIALGLVGSLFVASPGMATTVCDSSDYRTTISNTPCPFPNDATNLFPLAVTAFFNNGTSDLNIWNFADLEVDGWDQMPTGGTVDSFRVQLPGGGSATVKPGDSAYIPVPGTNCTLRVDYRLHGSTTTPPGTYLCPHVHIILICPPCGEDLLLAQPPKEQELTLAKPQERELP